MPRLFTTQKHTLSVPVCATVTALAAAGAHCALGQVELASQRSESGAGTGNAEDADKHRPSEASELYGIPWNADDLANINLGRWGTEVSYRILDFAYFKIGVIPSHKVAQTRKKPYI